MKRAFILLAATVLAVVSIAGPAMAARDRTLYLYYTHTKETAKITFKRNGRYDKKGLAQLNAFLRDWRRNEPTKMDPRLFDLIWEVYQDVGAKKPVHVVSAYRSPKTNEMLRSRSSAVAKNSNHTRGLAMDFFIPGVPISKLRRAAMKKQMGGVGYYPTSGSPFVHLDTGSVRAWPRMTTAQLKKVFPKGKTMHIPSNGVVLSKAGYAKAKADYRRCKQIPCNGTTRVASLQKDDNDAGSGRTLMDVLFGRNKDDVKVAKAPAQRAVQSQVIKVAALGQLPPSRPVALQTPNLNTAPAQAELAIAVAEISVTPPIRPETVLLATATSPLVEDDFVIQVPSRFAVASIDPNELPNPSRFVEDASAQSGIIPQLPNRAGINAAPNANAADALLAAYAPTSPPASPDAQKALEIILNRQNGATELRKTFGETNDKTNLGSGIRAALATASLQPDFNDFTSILQNARIGNTKSTVMKPTYELQQRAGELHAPDLEHVLDLMTEPARFQSTQYAVMFEPDEADLAPSVVMGDKSQFGFVSKFEQIVVGNISFKPTNSL